MPSFQTDVLDHIAQVVGGTASTTAHFFSGAQAADGTGVTGLKGCWSQAPGSISNAPIGVVLPGAFTDTLLGGQGKEEAEDEVKILLLVAKYDQKSQFGILTPFRDTVPAAFRAHMQAFTIPDVLDCFITRGASGLHTWGGIDYLAWDFTCRVRRLLSVTYTA